MQNNNQGRDNAPIVSLEASPQIDAIHVRRDLDLKASQLLGKFQSGDPSAQEEFRTHHPVGTRAGFTPALLDARQVLLFQNMKGRRLSLEKLKKEAKRFLKDLKSADEISLQRARTRHPKILSGSRDLKNITLVDVQHILALEYGFQSWPKLKNHVDALEAAKRNLASGTRLDKANSLHIRCGNDIKQGLKDAGLQGDFMEVINPFSMGPVLPDRLDATSLKLRCDYMTAVLGPFIEPHRRENMEKSLVDEEKALLALPGTYKDITIWCEHDAYDQLCLAYVLHHLSRLSPHIPFAINLVQVDHYPGVKRFVGIGQLVDQPESLALLYQQRIPVTPAMISFGATLWEAFTQKDPTDLWSLSNEDKAPLPLLQNAMKRMLAELPSPKNGLGLTQRLALDIIAKEGSLLARRAFLFSMAERDPQPYHGDIMFYAILKALWQANNPALEVTGHIEGPGDHGKEILKLTPLGHDLLNGKENWLHLNEIQQWVGGTEINSRFDKNWYFSGTGPFLME